MQTIPISPAIDQPIPKPILLNPWKHHRGYVQARIQAAIHVGPSALISLTNELIVIGNVLMDFYLGSHTLNEIGDQLVDHLQEQNLLEPEAYRDWLEENAGYQMWQFEDGSLWTLRVGEDTERYIHLHPGRWSPRTCRVRANVLKTAILVHTVAGMERQNPFDLRLINRVRQKYLDLAPVPFIHKTEGLGEMIDLLSYQEEKSKA